jgi:hypothetical protein
MSKFGVPKCAKSRFLLYSSVYDFRSERSAPGPPILDPFLRKVQPICGEWHFYRGHLWGSKSVTKLQKSAKFQKIYKYTPPDPPGPKKSIFDDFGPPHGISNFSVFWGRFWAIYNGTFDPPFWTIYSTQFSTSFWHQISSLIIDF